MEGNIGHVQALAWNNSVSSVEDASFDEEVLVMDNVE
jgi:hypothetical protein